jgi:hypothetical protein
VLFAYISALLYKNPTDVFRCLVKCGRTRLVGNGTDTHEECEVITFERQLDAATQLVPTTDGFWLGSTSPPHLPFMASQLLICPTQL